MGCRPLSQGQKALVPLFQVEGTVSVAVEQLGISNYMVIIELSVCARGRNILTEHNGAGLIPTKFPHVAPQTEQEWELDAIESVARPKGLERSYFSSLVLTFGLADDPPSAVEQSV